MLEGKIYKRKVFIYLAIFVFNIFVSSAIVKYILNIPPNLVFISFVNFCFFIHTINKEDSV